MSDQVPIIDSSMLKQILFALIIPLVIFYITTYIAISIKKKSIEIEKNQYLKSLSQNISIQNAFRKIDYLNYHKNQSIPVFFLGISFGVIYFLLISSVLLFLYPHIVSVLNYVSLVLLNVETINEQKLTLIFFAYSQIIFLPLFLLITILFYLIECGNKINIIKPNIIKRKQLGRKYQILKCKFLYSIKICKPYFTNEMNLTNNSTRVIKISSILMAISLTTNFCIYVFLFGVLFNQTKIPVAFSLEYLYGVYLSAIGVFGNGIFFALCICLISLMFVTLFCSWLYQQALSFVDDRKNEIIRFYSKDYPFVCIKTTSGILEGKIEDVFNKHFILLNDDGTQKITLWNKVGIIEMKKKDE